ncbi:2-oxoacid:acceptor oxidoreductase family protein [uncultured Mailhella sp.]|uniref:2-oxoacid:acceptor oxidoreductase family protein n=1 Tax=uncultured Mailhella sp. TaxID=1981031 RepID=UPI00261F7592|nr:2-oxoacid:acceptor oxidoreductase family protein [uncultured Mailhella sp.]
MSTHNFVTMDGNTAAAYVAYAFSEVASIYPITPSSNMAEQTDVWAASGRRNLFGQPVSLVEMQSEAGAIAAAHGALQTGSLAVSFTSSQGLLLMIPVLHRIAGELLPCVLHVASRTVGTHAMSIFGDHSDVMNCRQTGFAMLCTGSVQEVMDLAGLAHLAAIQSRIPFLHFFDGFRTSHELCNIEKIDLDALASLLDRDALARFRAQALNPEHPKIRGTVQNSDVFFQIREASNRFYDALPDEVEALMQKISAITGREYHLFNYYGAPDAEEVVIAMGSVSGCAMSAVDWLRARGRKAGFLQVHLYRPFSAQHLKQALPPTVKRIAVLDRCKEPGAAGEPLYEDVCTALSGHSGLVITGGRYGLSSKDTDESLICDVFDNLHSPHPKNGFTIGVDDDVTRRSLPRGRRFEPDAHTFSCKFWGLGSDGTVGANRNTVDIVNSTTKLYAQAYFEFDAKKSYGVTKSHLRFSSSPIRTSSLVRRADIVACHNETFVGKYDMAEELKEHGLFLLNSSWPDDMLEQRLPASLRRTLAQKHARLFVIDASALAQSLGLGSYVNNILQAAFFRIADIMPLEAALSAMEEAVRRTYFAKGDAVVARNLSALRAGVERVREVPVQTPYNGGQLVRRCACFPCGRAAPRCTASAPPHQRAEG